MSVSRFSKGISTAAKGKGNDVLWNYQAPDPTKLITWWDDFYDYDASRWVVTTSEVGTGSATEALNDEVGGVLKLTTSQGDNDHDFLQWAGEESSTATEIFKITDSEEAWFKARFKISEATQSDFVMGLQIVDTTPLDTADGIFFQKDDGDTNLDFHVEKSGTQSSLTGIHTMANDTYITAGFYYDGRSTVHAYVNDQAVGSVDNTNLPDDQELTISFGLQNGASASTTGFEVDYILFSQERP